MLPPPVLAAVVVIALAVWGGGKAVHGAKWIGHKVAHTVVRAEKKVARWK